MYSRVYTLPLFALVTLLLSTLGAAGQTGTSCDTIQLADRTVYVMRGEKDTQIEVASRHPEGQEQVPLYIDQVWTRGGRQTAWNRSRVSAVHKQDGRPVIYKTLMGDVSYHFVGSFGWNLFTAPEWVGKQRFWSSARYEFGVYGILQLGRSPWAFNVGTSFVRSIFAFDKKYALQRDDEGLTIFKPEPTGVGYARTQLDIFSIEMPVGLSLSWGETNAWSSLAVVPKFVCLQKSTTRSLDERVNTLVDNDLNVRPFGVDLRGEIGYGFFGLFGQISLLSTMPSAQAEVSTRDYSIGIVARF
ncbi:outer membrane beta-barrel protein [uncultured Porphyromonas sp.]|uniref:outer membrane beta-barrel protein n=1 Tax=uncultured Porphyromonas sp. TaxID=159274 RepID=UPI002804F4A8|nr:outer membrane beta-barrel protein [uncultured Porphyromonas sp.]